MIYFIHILITIMLKFEQNLVVIIFFIFIFVIHIWIAFFFKYSYIFYIYVLFGFDGFFIWYIIIFMYFTNFFVCFVFKLILLFLHAILCAMTLKVINHKNMANFVIVFDVKTMYMIISSNPSSFMNFGKKLGWPSSLLNYVFFLSYPIS